MKSSSYFEERSELRMKKMHDKATKCMTKVNKAYDDSLERLKKEIDHIMSDYSPTEKIDYDKYKELLQIYNTTKDKRVKAEAKRLIKENSASYRIQRKEALSKAIEIEKLKQVDTQLNLGGKHLKNVYSSVLSDLGGARVSEKYLDEVLNHNWAGSNFSKRVWHNQDVLAKSLESNLLQSFASGKSNKQIADELEYHTNLGRYAANRLIRTETSYMVNSADLESSKQRGIKAKKFQANLDKRTSKICREHNQKVILIDDIKIGENAPPLHPFCRSFLSDVLEGWDYETEEELQALVSENNVDSTEENGYNINKLELTKLSQVFDEKDFEEFKNIISGNEKIKKIYSEYGDLPSKIEVVKKGACYNPEENSLKLRINRKEEIESGLNKFSVVAHEYGHFFDANIKINSLSYKELEMYNEVLPKSLMPANYRLSGSDEFINALREDKKILKQRKFEDLKNELIKFNASSGVQDAIDGMFEGDSYRIRWGHGEDYYNRKYNKIKKYEKIVNEDYVGNIKKGYIELGYEEKNIKVKSLVRDFETASEAWANITSAITCGGEELKFIKKYLPNSYNELLKILKEV